MFPADRLAPLLLGQLSREELARLPLIEEYRLLYPIGRGGMGCVYRAQDTLLDRPVAIKFLGTGGASTEGRERFVLEARAIARLSHPNVVIVYRVGEVCGQPYLISEYVRGTSLDRMSKPLPGARVLEIGRGLACGLAAAHRRGVLHRDIKPGNAILAEDGIVKLLDFGLAKLLDATSPAVSSSLPPILRRSLPPISLPARLNIGLDTTSAATDAGSLAFAKTGALGGLPPLADAVPTAPVHPRFGESPADITAAGSRMGTPLYMAPEMWRGDPATAQVDIYSLGALLFELGAGRPPHRGETLEELGRAVQDSDAPPLLSLAPTMQPELARIIDRCLRRDASKRFETVDALCQALEALDRLPVDAGAAAGNPYRGLYPFESEHRDLFFGRAIEARTLLERLRVEPMVLVAGDSGVGKSSLCRAGVLAAVQAGALGQERKFSVISLVPGQHPLTALADALAAPLGCGAEALVEMLRQAPGEVVRRLHQRQGTGRGLLLFIDQVEELLTLSETSEARTVSAALGGMAVHSPGLRVLLTARGDFLTRLAALPGLGGELNKAVYILGALSRDGLREAITGPAQVRGVQFESEALVEDLVASTLDAEGGLPLLQFALAEVWEARDRERRLITHGALAAIGGVSGALARHADRLFAGLAPAHGAAARRLLLQLVTTQGLRLRRSRAELFGSDPFESLALDVLVRGRLLAVRQSEPEPTYEIAHEALVRGWPLLRRWLDGEAEQQAVRERLSTAAAEWRRLGQAADLLWSERQLGELESVGIIDESLSSAEAEFVRAARQRLSSKLKQRRTVRLALLIIPLFLGLLAFQHNEARRQHQLAEEQSLLKEQVARSELGARAVSLAQLPGREVLALMTSIQAIAWSWRSKEAPLPAALEGLSESVESTRQSLPLHGHSGQIMSVAVSPDGRQLVTGSQDQSARLWDIASGQFLLSFDGHLGPVSSVGFSPDGQLIVTTSQDRTARLWERQGGRELARLEHSGEVRAAFFSPDGKRLLTSTVGRSLARSLGWLWDVKTRKLIAQVAGNAPMLAGVPFSPDGRLFVLGNSDGTLRVLSAATGELHRLYHLPPSEHLAANEMLFSGFSPDGSLIFAYGGIGPKVWLLESATGRPRTTLYEPQSGLSLVAFSPDSKYVLTGGQDGAGWLWDARSGALRTRLRGHTLALSAAAFSPDNLRLVTAAWDQTVRVWEVPGGQLVDRLRGHSDVVTSVRFAPDGQRVITGGQDHTARIWNALAGQHLLQFLGHRDTVTQAVYSPDGKTVATASQDHTARVWDAETGRELAILEHHEMVMTICFSPDGQLLATSTIDGELRIWRWQAGTSQVVVERRREAFWNTTQAFSPDGQRLAVSAIDRSVQVLDWRTRQRLFVLHGHTAPVSNVTFSADGARIASADGNGVVRVWDAKSGKPLLTSGVGSGRAASVSFSPDGRFLVGGGAEPHIWDVMSGAPSLDLLGHLDAVVSATFMRDGRRIVTQGQDQTVRVFDARSGKQLHVLHIEDGTYAEPSPDGRRILVTHATGNRAAVYPATVEQLFAEGCELLRPQPQWPKVQRDCLEKPPQSGR